MDYPCIVFNQRPDNNGPRFCIFNAKVSDILEWATIPRLSPEKMDGIQRAKNDYRVKGITKFLSDESRNTIPTAIVVALSQGSFGLQETDTQVLSVLTIDSAQKNSALVVDGQHRLYGINQFSPESLVPVVAILNASDDEKAFQFIVINNKVSKVPTDHIRALTLTYTEKDLEDRLKTARLSLGQNLSYVGLANDLEGSPFKGLVSFPNIVNENRWVIATAIESSLSYIQASGIKALPDDDTVFDYFLTIWTTIRQVWSFGFAKDSKLLSKVGMVCMTKHVVDVVELMTSYSDDPFDITNAEDVKDAVTKVLEKQQEAFWLAEWRIPLSDTKAVRDQVQEALKEIHQNIKLKTPWQEGIELLK